MRTRTPEHVQPCSMTRQAFWEHLVRVFAEVYPDPDSPTGSILRFGLVAQEKHRDSAREEHRAEHKHAATFASTQYYWSKVAKASLSKCMVPLNAVAHDGYATMYAYLRRPTAKKPLQELDAEPYMSPLHPRGHELVTLLEASKKFHTLHAQRRPAAWLCIRGATELAPRIEVCARRPLSGERAMCFQCCGHASPRANVARARSVCRRCTVPRRCEHAGRRRGQRQTLFEVISANGLRTVEALRAFAASEASAGRHTLAEYCTRQGHKLGDILDNAWAVADAPEQARAPKSLTDKLARAAEELPCECEGRWTAGACAVLGRNNINPDHFAQAVYRALAVGAKRGANVACVGEGGCGKSTLLEPLEKIFACAPKPEEGSTFPLGSCIGYDIMLWQDYEHDEKTIRFSDLLSWFCGESVGARIPGRLNQKFRNVAPCFYSGRATVQLRTSARHAAEAAAKYNGMMDERFTTFRFGNPLPLADRDMTWPHCGRCAAQFYMQGRVAAPADPVVDAPIAGVAAAVQDSAPSDPASFSRALADIVALHREGALDAEEFRLAKRRLLGPDADAR